VRKSFAGLMLVVGLILAAVGFSAGAGAATTGSVSFTFTLLTHQELTIAYSSGSAVSFGNVDPEVPTVAANYVTINVKSNKPYDLRYNAPGDFTSGTSTIPITRMDWGTAGTGPWTAFTSSQTTVVTNHAKSTGLGDNFNYYYRLTCQYEDDPTGGAYTGTVEYEVIPHS